MNTQVHNPVTTWDPMAPLDPGVMLLEASAGTGKTYNLVNWVLRLIVQYHIPIEQQVVVTFTRAATAELKDRIRSRLQQAMTALGNPSSIDPSDIVMERLVAAAQTSREHQEDVVQRIAAAQESFDACLISTIHGFCQRMLQHYAFEAQTDFDLTLMGDEPELAERLVDDWLSSELYGVDASRYEFLVNQCGFTRDTLLAIATVALREPDMTVVPTDPLLAEGSPAWHRVRFVKWLRSEYDEVHRKRRTQSYIDLMRNLVRVLDKKKSDPSRCSLLQAVQHRYKVALIDEFQDTDAMQWKIFRTLFSGEDQRLYLIGDPKQAIYGFRGANVHVYLKAKKEARGRVSTIVTNHRSDQRFVEAINHLMNRRGLFGQEGIEYQAVQAAIRPQSPVDRLIPPDDWFSASNAPFQLRFLDRRLEGVAEATDADRRMPADLLYKNVPKRVAEDIVLLLESGTRIFVERQALTGEDKTRCVEPSDIAVLTRTGKEANAIQQALGTAGVPAVLMGADSVFASVEAFELLLWLEALDKAGHERAARAAATTHLFGRNAGLLAGIEAERPEALEAWEAWMERLHRWRKRFENHGLLSTLRYALQDDLVAVDGEILQDATARLLMRPDGQRRLTNVWHVAELMHGVEVTERRSLTGLIDWLKRERMNPSKETDAAELRLDRDDKAVRISTMHKAKGLQFPIVFVPYLWTGRLPKDTEPAVIVPETGDHAKRVCDLRDAADRQDSYELAVMESRKEAIRLLYVALTRARHRCVVYLGHINHLENSALAPVFHGHHAEGASIERGVERAARENHSVLWKDLQKLASKSGSALEGNAPTISLTFCTPPEARIWKGQPGESGDLTARDFLRHGLDGSFRRLSYSALTYGKSVTYVDTDKDREGVDADEQTDDGDEAMVERQEQENSEATDDQENDRSVSDPSSRWVPTIEVSEDSPNVPLAVMWGGADVGTFFHEVFEKADFRWAHPSQGADGGRTRLWELVRALLGVHGFDTQELTEPITAGLMDVLQTPLRSVLGDTRLCDIAKEDRLDELSFDFPMAGGDRFRRGGPTKRVLSEAF
ncbi:MAG TPA: UvrD-helicase domain-containing protein, partial [Polyangiaceae bacterium]|nr:UvrD-helicase domain-containing protein [Polyangiaceae bacterium]